MITEQDYLKAKKLIADYEAEQLNKPVVSGSFIVGKVERCLHQGGYKPYSLSTYPHKVKGTDNSFSTLKDLKDYFGITTIVKKGKGWAINSSGKKIEWDEYEAEISIKRVLD